MKEKFYLIVSLMLFISVSCNKSSTDDIKFYHLDEELILPPNLDEIINDTNNTNPAYDSLINNLVDGEIISTGIYSVDINGMGNSKIQFEIVDLHTFNTSLPDELDSLVIRVIPINASILDISNHNYPTAFDKGDKISTNVNYTTETSVLASFLDIGNFKGKENKYLAFRFKEEEADEKFKYGWFKISCSQSNDTIKIHKYAYSNRLGESINAGFGEQ